MTSATLLGIAAAALIGLGLFGTLFHRDLLRRVVAFNLVGAGVFLFFGVVARRGAVAQWPSDPVPQAMVITGIVVAFAGTALALAFARRLFELGGRTILPEESDEEPTGRQGGRGA